MDLYQHRPLLQYESTNKIRLGFTTKEDAQQFIRGPLPKLKELGYSFETEGKKNEFWDGDNDTADTASVSSAASTKSWSSVCLTKGGRLQGGGGMTQGKCRQLRRGLIGPWPPAASTTALLLSHSVAQEYSEVGEIVQRSCRDQVPLPTLFSAVVQIYKAHPGPWRGFGHLCGIFLEAGMPRDRRVDRLLADMPPADLCDLGPTLETYAQKGRSLDKALADRLLQVCARVCIPRFAGLVVPPPPPLYKVRPCPSYNSRRDCRIFVYRV